MGGADIFDETIAVLLERSPLFHADSITTPLLLLHGEDDKRCPIEQSEQLFTALKRLNREVVMIRFPGESHGLTSRGRPDHRTQRMEVILDWLRQHP
jgi:dipeptidyl aminopeptidase/acylaminoacyl peptidase